MFFLKDYQGAPANYMIVVDVDPTKTKQGGKPYSALVGYARKPEDVQGKIREHERAIGNTYGGLFSAEDLKIGKRKYRVFKANWEQIK